MAKARRKPHNMQARMARSCRALLASNHVAVVNIDPSGRQGLINWRNCKSIRPGQQIADAVCDYPYAWVIYLSALCVDQFGKRYIKSIEVAPLGQYRSDALTDVIEHHYRALLDTCNPQHVVASGWIANPSGVSLDEEQAARVYDAVGAWNQQEAA
ncbi:hypothetical protein D3C84_593690 [compost metagenome]